MVEIDSPAVKQGRVPQQQQPLPSRHRRQSRRMAQIKAAIRIQASWRGYSGRSGGAAYVARCAAPAVLRPLSAHALCLSVSVRIHRGAVGSIKSSCGVTCVCVCVVVCRESYVEVTALLNKLAWRKQADTDTDTDTAAGERPSASAGRIRAPPSE